MLYSVFVTGIIVIFTEKKVEQLLNDRNYRWKKIKTFINVYKRLLLQGLTPHVHERDV